MGGSQVFRPATLCRSIPLARGSGASVQFAAHLVRFFSYLDSREANLINTPHPCNLKPPTRADHHVGRRKGNLQHQFLAFALLALALMPTATAYAESLTNDVSQTPQEKGLAIAVAADQADLGFGDTTADMTMVMNVANAAPIEREMRQLTLEVDNDGDKSILVFDRPRDLKGTAILTHTHRTGPDDQWLYLPALKRVKRISSADRSGPFMGSEFAYEDLASQEVEKYQYRFLREEPCDQQRCDVVERVPTDPKSGYSHQIAWFDQSERRLQRVDYFDRKKTHLKTMEMVGYTQYMDSFWRPDEMHMTNHQTGKSTVLKFANYRFQVGLDDKDFTRNAVSRMR